MQLEVTELDDFKVNVTFEADENEVEEKLADALAQYRQAQVPGFRKGKASDDVIKFHFNEQIQESAKQQLAQSAFSKSMAEKGIKPFGYPEFSNVQLSDKMFKCDFCVSRLPNVELKQYTKFDLPKGTVPSATEMAEKILQELRARNGETVPFAENDFVQDGDTVIINYEVFELENTQSSVVKKDGDMFVAGSHSVEAINENLLGLRVGERREFEGFIPVTSSSKHADKTMRFVVELVMASKSIPMPLDNTLAEKVGAKDIDDLIRLTNEMAGNRVQQLERAYLVKQASARLVEEHDFEVPSWLITHEAQLLSQQYNLTWDTLEADAVENLKQLAVKNIKFSLIMDKIRENEPDAQLTDEELMGLIQKNITQYKTTIAQMQDKSDEEILNLIRQSGYLGSLINSIRDDYTIDFVIKNSNIVE